MLKKLKYTHKQVIRNINISILSGSEMDSPYKEIYNYYQNLLSNTTITYAYAIDKRVICPRHIVIVDNENNKPIFIINEDSGGLLDMYIDADISAEALDYMSHKLSIPTYLVSYFFKYFVKHKYPTYIMHEIADIVKTSICLDSYINDTGLKLK